MTRPFPTATLLALFSLGFAACQGAESAPGEASQTAAVAEGPLAVTLVQGGFFGTACAGCPESRAKRPVYVHYGYVNQRGGPWEGVTDQTVAYGAAGTNEPLVINVPAGRRGQLLAYTFAYRPVDGSPGPDRWTNDRYLDLRYPEGKFVHVNLGVQSPYPFYDSCSTTYVTNEGEAQTSFSGKPSLIYYGFTSSRAADYAADNDVPWENASREFVADGVIDRLDFAHNGSYKGAYIMGAEWVRVPAERNLVFKVSYRTFSNHCSSSSPSSFAQSKTYFTEVD